MVTPTPGEDRRLCAFCQDRYLDTTPADADGGQRTVLVEANVASPGLPRAAMTWCGSSR